MKLYLEEKTFSFRDKYHICDENGNKVYYVINEFFTVKAKIHINDRLGIRKYLVKKKFTLSLGKYEILNGDNKVCATVSQELTLREPKIKVNSSYGKLDINGDYLNMNYVIYRNGINFGSVRKVKRNGESAYEIDIPPTGEVGFICALVLTIDNCMHYEEIN